MNAARRMIIADLVDDLCRIDGDLDALIYSERSNCTGNSEEYLVAQVTTSARSFAS